ncbi:MAG: serine/threonine protein kinase [Myxococcales bacterium]|nr:serine/threonine protein kinase [Myxococcales bacterium]
MGVVLGRGAGYRWRVAEERRPGTTDPAVAPTLAAESVGDKSSSDHDAWIGRTVAGRYRVESLLGEGGMGLVFVAEHLALRKKVALKVILPSFSNNEEIATRFAREAMASAQLDHPHVVSAIDYGELDRGGAYLAMQLVGGVTLREWINEQVTIPWQEVVGIGVQIASALEAAHRAGVIHRDLKPENLLCERRSGVPFVRLTDFGIARILSDLDGPDAARSGASLTQVGVVVGTPGYMAPEQAVGQPVDPRADLYALGVVLWEALSGEVPFAGDELTAILGQQLVGPPPLGSVARGVPESLRRLLEELLAPRAEDRPASAGEVLDRLAAIERGGPAAVARGAALPGPKRYQVIGGWAVGAVALAVLAAAGAMVFAEGPALEAPIELHPDAGVSSAAAGIVESEDPAPSIAETVEALLNGAKRRDRVAAADLLLGHRRPEEIPGFARAVAEFERGRTCKARKKALDAIGAAGDPRALPALKRAQGWSRRGCRPFGLGDCHACLRAPLRDAIKALERR